MLARPDRPAPSCLDSSIRPPGRRMSSRPRNAPVPAPGARPRSPPTGADVITKEFLMMFMHPGRAGVAALALALLAVPAATRADIIYDVTGLNSNDFVPFENDGTPNRPPGDHLGNQVTFAGTERALFHVQAVFASIGPREVDTYTLDLYRNDGAIDPSSGL